MKITVFHTLNPVRKAGIRSLLDACRTKDLCRFSFPYEDADLYILAGSGSSVPAAAAFSRLEDNLWECTAFTRPEFRRHGYFRALLETGTSCLPPEAGLVFYVNAKSADAAGAMDAIGAEICAREHMMEYRFPPDYSAPPLPGGLRVTESADEDTPVLSYEGYFGSVRIAVYENSCYLYGLEIAEEHRGRGNGRKLLLAVLTDLFNRSPRPIRLQVSGENLPALALYNKTGFRITETLLCYLY